MKVVFATSLDNDTVFKACCFLEKLLENKNIIYLREPIDKRIKEKYDIGLSFMYNHKIPMPELDVPWINWHPGLLPNYRGRNVIYHAIMNDELSFGGTIHYIDKNFDTGNIIEVDYFPITDDDNSGSILYKTYNSLVHLFYKYVPRILDGELPDSYPQVDGHYYKKTDIDEYINLDYEQKTKIRALTVHPKHHAKIKIGNKIYKIVPEESI